MHLENEILYWEAGGCLEAHPRLTTGTLYRSVDSVITMKHAREILLAMAPEGFSISLSACYNYTESYRQGSAQAVRHHTGRDVNAGISLKKPPRTGVQEVVINLHWSTCNINYIIDTSQKLSRCLVLSKDAKAVVMADISPVQLPGPSWKKREQPDHTWDQSRKNAITPMTFLFLETKITGTSSSSQDTIAHITRTGQAVTLLYLSFFEPDTTFKCMNEIFHLLANPDLDHLFRDKETGKLKKEFVFVVDNGPQEKPSNSLVQMCMARIMGVLKLHKISQLSFAEYHSKRNFVERVHAEENRTLSKHGSFTSQGIHKNPVVGSTEHHQNMEHMAGEVSKCIGTATYGGKSLLCYRGIKSKDYLFDDEDCLSKFLSLSEQSKEAFMDTYQVKSGELLTQLHVAWDVDFDFKGNYLSDYRLINNDLIEERTAWKDKYSTILYSPSSAITCCRGELQPVPDIPRWIKTHELHYVPWQEAALLEHGPWNDIPGLFVPTKILDLCFLVIPNPSQDMAQLIALLAWVAPSEAKEYYDKLDTQVSRMLEADHERTKWKQHPLYSNNTKEELEKICRTMKLPVTSSVTKHQLVSLITKKRGEEEPRECSHFYTGKLNDIPKTITAINHLPVAKLREILHYHRFPILGTKDQLALRVYLLRHSQTAAITGREEEQIKDFINVFKLLIFAQKKLQLSCHTYQKRTYTTKVYQHRVSPPSNITISNSHNLFEPLIKHLQNLRKSREAKDRESSLHLFPGASNKTNDSQMEKLKQVGAKIRVRWTPEEIGDSGRRVGWYVAYVQAYDDDSDTLTVEYVREPGCTYIIDLTSYVHKNKICLLKSVI